MPALRSAQAVPRRRGSRWVAVGALASTALLVLAGCAPVAPAVTPTPERTFTANPTPVANPTATPELRPGKSAAANQQFFDQVNADFFAAHGKSDGRSIIDILVAAGFTKADMEVTADETAAGVAADSIVFSVRFKKDCLIGQFADSGYTSELAPALSTGLCLVGTTRSIDW